MNVEKYLPRIGIETDGLTPDFELLRRLQLQHLLTVPFENLDIHWGTPILLDTDRFFAKIVDQKRGGFCYELNGLFNELLKELGFVTRMVSARVFGGEKGFGPEFDHAAIIVTIGDMEYLADVGFGDFTAEPLSFVTDLEQQDREGRFVTRQSDGEYFEVAKKNTDGLTAQYIFKPVDRQLSEFAEMCDFQQYSPKSHFTKGKICSLMTETGRKSLSDNKFVVTANGQKNERAVDDRGQTLGYDEIETHEPDGPMQAVVRTVQACQQIAAKVGLSIPEVTRVGLGTPGTMDLKRGMFLQPPNLPNWWEFPIRDRLSEAIGRPVSFVNDANAAALGEFWIGSGEKFDNLVLLTLGTGVGGGIIVDGHLINGINSFGSECGHIIVDCRPDARLCVWGGGRGHLEAYSSASAVAQRAEEGLRKGRASSLVRLAMAGKAITAKRVYEAAEQGDEFALEIIDETAFFLGVGITSLVHTIDPGIVVLGGAMNFGGSKSHVGRRFLERIRQEFGERTFPNVKAGTVIDFATLGADAGYLGAAGYARQELRDLK